MGACVLPVGRAGSTVISAWGEEGTKFCGTRFLYIDFVFNNIQYENFYMNFFSIFTSSPPQSPKAELTELPPPHQARA